MCPYSEFLWSAFSHIRIEYEDWQGQSKCGKIWTRKISNTDTFHEVQTVAKFSRTLRSEKIADQTDFRDLRTRHKFTQIYTNVYTNFGEKTKKKTADFLFVKHHTI